MRKLKDLAEDFRIHKLPHGQFESGLYAAYLVSDKVCGVTEHIDGEQYIWNHRQASATTSLRDTEVNDDVVTVPAYLTSFCMQDFVLEVKATAG